MQLPKNVQIGDKVSADWANSVVNFLRSIRPINGVGVMVSQTANGTTFSAPARASQSSPAKFPLTAYLAGTIADNLKIKIVAGLVGVLEPTIEDIEISNSAAFLSVPKEGVRYVYLKLEFTDELDTEPTTVKAVVESELKEENLDYENLTTDERKTAWILLAKIDSGTITNYRSSSLSVNFCSPHLFFWSS